MIRLGLTGSIGMGKTTTARMFAARGVPIYDSDLAVHVLYRGRAVEVVAELFPDVVKEEAVDRAALARRVLGDPDALAALEAAVHPLVREEEAAFLNRAAAANARRVVLDIPLLFEAGRAGDVDAVVLVTTSEAVQRERVMRREGMTEEKLAAILARQMPDAEKRRRSHFLLDTSRDFDAAERAVDRVLRATAAMTDGRSPDLL